ncbi:hypothetical protein F5148DRAFT_1290904 [Russula earlei]|uniref:Uncharacterized protein n=1 Tax=Russula earlei TaxID=71964 RepID=A0ACC0TV10_9AGAM|nr:hypothetical protein F5148DRAFT_1290904 [Russula earlei]
MAIHEGIIEISGKLGNEVYYTRNGKRYVRKLTGQKINQSKGTRKSSSDFGRANAATGLIRLAFKPLISQFSDNQFDGRLKSTLIKIVNTGPKVLQGKREVTDGDVALLKKLAFNRHTPVNRLITIVPFIAIDPTGDLTISLPGMPVKDLFYPPAKATAAVLQFCCCVFYFDKKNGRYKRPEDLHISLQAASFPGGKFSLPIADSGDCVLVVAWGIHFTYDNDRRPICDRKYYAGSIIEAVNIVDGKIVSFQYPERIVTAKAATTENRVAWEMNEEGENGE